MAAHEEYDPASPEYDERSEDEKQNSKNNSPFEIDKSVKKIVDSSPTAVRHSQWAHRIGSHKQQENEAPLLKQSKDSRKRKNAVLSSNLKYIEDPEPDVNSRTPSLSTSENVSSKNNSADLKRKLSHNTSENKQSSPEPLSKKPSPDKNREDRLKRPEPFRKQTGNIQHVGATVYPYSPASLLVLSSTESAVEDFTTLADRIYSNVCRDVKKATAALGTALDRVLKAPRTLEFLRLVVGVLQGAIASITNINKTSGSSEQKGDNSNLAICEGLITSFFGNIKISVDTLQSEEQKKHLETALEFAVWLHQILVPSTSKQPLMPAVKLFFDKVESRIEAVRQMGPKICTANTAAYLRAVRNKLLCATLTCVKQDTSAFLGEESTESAFTDETTIQCQAELLMNYCQQWNVYNFEEESTMIRSLKGGNFTSTTLPVEESNGKGGEADGLPMSLQCPLTLARIHIPARGRGCQHPQCFDLRAFLLSACHADAKSQREGGLSSHPCPICQQHISLPNLMVSACVSRALRDTPESVREVKL